MKTINSRILGIFFGTFLAIAFFGSSQAQIKPWTAISGGAQRFQVLDSFGGTAVLDRETGLIWTKLPLTNTTAPGLQNMLDWQFAYETCLGQAVGPGIFSFGWRLPKVEELMSLKVGSVAGPDDTDLPLGHPFLNVLNSSVQTYWSSTTVPNNAAQAYAVHMNFNFDGPTAFEKSSTRGVWCVRGGSN